MRTHSDSRLQTPDSRLSSPRITLTFHDEAGRPRRVDVASARFGVGRSSDNDLPVSNPSLSRRHALIEVNGDSVSVSDCGSRNGTTVNGSPVSGAAPLRDGDVITLGGVFNLSVAIGDGGAPVAAPAADSSAFARASSPPPPVAAGGAPPSFWLAPPVMIAAAAGGIILLVAGLLVALTWSGGPYSGSLGRRPTGGDNIQNVSAEEDGDDSLNLNVSDEDAIHSVDTPRGVRNANETSGVPPSVETTQADEVPDDGATTVTDSAPPVSREARRAMERISNETAPYIPPAGVEAIAARVNAYRGSTALGAKLQAMRRGCAGIKSLAQSNGLKPALVMYAALAASGSSAAADPVAAAREMIPELLTLRATFGTDTANSSLLLVAATAYEWRPPVGTAVRTPHPLASKLQEFGGRKSFVETSTARSVWFLREKNGIGNDAYDLVVRLLAVGVIARNPRQYGINADPLLC